MILIQDDHEIPLALIANHELVALPRQVFPIEEVTSAFMAKKNSVTTNVNFLWHFMMYLIFSLKYL